MDIRVTTGCFCPGTALNAPELSLAFFEKGVGLPLDLLLEVHGAGK